MAADKGFSLPTAQQAMEKLALAEAEKASAAVRKQAELESEKKMLRKRSPSRRATRSNYTFRTARLATSASR